MTTQAPSHNIGSDIDLGNCLVYYNDATFSSFTSAESSTKWRKLGMIKDAVQIERQLEQVAFFSGVPARKAKTYYTKEEFKISGAIMELNPRAVARIAGGLGITETVKVSSPAATTVATGSTKSVVNVASASGYAPYDEIRVGNSGSYQYGRVASINGNAIALVEDLSGDANPTTGHAVAKIDTSYFDLGSVAAPADIAVKVTKTTVGGYGTWELITMKANFLGNFSMAFADGNGSIDAISIPFEVEALSVPANESGKLARWKWSHL